MMASRENTLAESGKQEGCENLISLATLFGEVRNEIMSLLTQFFVLR